MLSLNWWKSLKCSGTPHQNRDTINYFKNTIVITITKTAATWYVPSKQLKLICMCFFFFVVLSDIHMPPYLRFVPSDLIFCKFITMSPLLLPVEIILMEKIILCFLPKYNYI